MTHVHPDDCKIIIALLEEEARRIENTAARPVKFDANVRAAMLAKADRIRALAAHFTDPEGIIIHN